MKTTAIIVAAGSGERLREPCDKPYVLLGDEPMGRCTLRCIAISPLVDDIVLVVKPGSMAQAQEVLAAPLGITKPLRLVEGGETRQRSVCNGVEAVPVQTDIIVVHDAARPFVSLDMIERLIRGVGDVDAVIPGLPVPFTVKEVDDNGFVVKTLDREKVWEIQTPQVFHAAVLRQAHTYAREHALQATDDAALCEHIDRNVKVLMGERTNIKITTPEDLAMARMIIKQE